MSIAALVDLDSGLDSYELCDDAFAPGDGRWEVHDVHGPLDFEIQSQDAHQDVTEYYRDVIEQDRVFRRTWAAHTRQHKQLAAVNTGGRVGLGRPTWSSGDESIATIGSDGLARHVGNGTVSVSANCNGAIRSVVLGLSGIPAYSQQEVDLVAGTARAAIVAELDGLLAGKTPAEAKPIFSSQDHAAPAYVRNTGCWAAGIDLTPISPWNSDGAGKRGGMLVSPRHAIWAQHYPIGDGATLRFVTADNQVIDRTVTGSQQIGSSDIRLGVLNEDVPGSIGFAKILPSDWATYLPGDGADLPFCGTDQEEKLLVFETVELAGGTIVFSSPAEPVRKSFWELLIGGDSGNPALLIVGGQLVLLSTWYTAYSGASVSYYLDQINAAMSGYQLSQVDLSGYTEFE